jgi:hypothetical protein
MRCAWQCRNGNGCGRETDQLVNRPTYRVPDEWVQAPYCSKHIPKVIDLTGGYVVATEGDVPTNTGTRAD